MKPSPPLDERPRLDNLDSYRILDTPPEQAFDNLTALAAEICETPIALISLVDATRQWFKSKVGIDESETPREIAFCFRAISQEKLDPFVVADAAKDPRFSDNPLVTSDPHVRFYAGIPLVSPEGYPLGTLCVIDRKPRELSDTQIALLDRISRQVMNEIAMRRAIQEYRAETQKRQETEERYTRLFNNATEGIVQYDVEGRLISANPAMARVLGYESSEELLRCLNVERRPLYVNSDDRARLVRAMIRAKPTAAEEYPLCCKDGSTVWVRGSGRAVRDTDGKILYFEGIVGDISDRKKMEIVLRESAERFKALAESAPVGIFLADKTGARNYFNPRWFEITGISPENAQGRVWVNSLHPDDRERVDEQWRVAVSTGAEFTSHHRYLRPNGETAWVYTIARPIRDSNGKVSGYVGTTTDITELKLTAQERDRFFTITLDMLCVIGFDGYFKRLNPAWAATLGYTAEEMSSSPFIDFVHPDDHERTIAEASSVADGKDTLRFENRYRCKDGSYRWILWNAAPDLDRGVMYASARDITEIKEFETELRETNAELEVRNKRIEEANRLKSEFLANMSHELRTPLNSIIGFAELIQNDYVGPVTDQQKDLLGDILTSGRHLLQLINDILDLSKIEAGKLEFFPEPIDLVRVIEEVTVIIGALASKKNIRIETKVEDEARNLVIDSGKLKQVLYNYLSNAVKFTPEQGTIRVRAARIGVDQIRIEVQDSGIGIPAESIPLLFQEFQQLDQGKSKKYQGTGLGLALTKKIVEAQSGTVGVWSAMGEGSTFYAVLPKTPINA